MKKLALPFLVFALLFGFTATTFAYQLTPTAVTGNGNYGGGGLSVLTDDVFPTEGSSWLNLTNVNWTGYGEYFVFDLGDTYRVIDIALSVDNNDAYAVEYSLDNLHWQNAFTILSGYGEIGDGMDTMDTRDSSNEFVSQIDFVNFNSRYLKLSAVPQGGDGLHALGEFQIYGDDLSPPAVPEPSTILLLGSGLLGLGWYGRKRKKS